jgi:hypothetical protein
MGELCINIPNEVLKSDDAVKAILRTVTNCLPTMMFMLNWKFRTGFTPCTGGRSSLFLSSANFTSLILKGTLRLLANCRLDLVCKADLEDTVKATVLTNAINNYIGSFAASQRAVVFSTSTNSGSGNSGGSSSTTFFTGSSQLERQVRDYIDNDFAIIKALLDELGASKRDFVQSA